MTTAQEIDRRREIAWEGDVELTRQGMSPRYMYTYFDWYHHHVYLPMMAKLIADMRAKGLLPKDPL